MDSNSRTTGLSCRKLLNEGDCTSIFQIPSQFVKSLGQNLPPKATLRIDQSGKCWKVKVEKFKDQYFFTDGWAEFAQAVDIKSWEFLVLNSAGFSEFGSSSDEISNDGYMELKSGEGNDSVLERQDVPCDEKMWRFTKELTENNLYRLVLPKMFSVETGIATTKKINLKDAKGRKWPVRVNNRCGDITMGAGWNDFLIANNVIVGSIILFKFVSRSNMMMEAQVVKEGPDGKALFNCVKRKRTKYEVVASCNASEGTDEKAVPNSVETKLENREAVSSRKKSAHEEESTNLSFKPTCESKDFGGGGRLSFSKKLKEHHVHMMAIPKEFVIGTGITKDRTIKLKDVEGKEWPVRATAKNCGMFSFTAGWSKFLVGNKVVVGSTMYFEFTSDNTIEARVIKMGTDEKALFSCVRRNGGKFEVSSSHKRSDHASLTVNCNPDAASINSKLSFSKELKKHDAYALGSLPDESNHGYMELNSGEDKDSVPDQEEAPCDGKIWNFKKELNGNNAYRLVLPKKFAIGTGIAKARSIRLKDAKGRKWQVHVFDSHGDISMRSGWHKFLVVNKVVVGSTVSFEFTSNDTIEARVVKVGTDENALFGRVKRNRGMFQVSTSHKSCSELTTNSRLNADCVNSKLSFFKELKKYHLYELSIPEDFVRRTGIAKLSKVKLQNGEGRKWTVRVTERYDRVFMSSGWSSFLKENSMVVGSTISFICISTNTIETHIAKEVTGSHELFKFVRCKVKTLELIESEKIDDHVMVHKSAGSSESPDPAHIHDSGKNEESVPEREEDPCVAKKWSFTRELKKRHAYKLVLPKKFAVNTGIATSKKITLKDAKGRKWPIRVGDSCGEIAMSSGWDAFLVANKVVVGSTLLFRFDSCSKMMIVQVVKEGIDENALFDLKAKKTFEEES